MAKNRWSYGVLLLTTFILAYVVPGSFTSSFVYGLLALLLFSLGYMLWVYFSFKEVQVLDKEVVSRGEKAQLSLTIYNENIIPYTEVEIKCRNINSLLGKYFAPRVVSIKPFGQKECQYSMVCHYRGCYEVGVEKVIINGFMGMMALKYQVIEGRYITVYPAVAKLTNFPFERKEAGELENIAATIRGVGSMMADIRPYAYGDSMRKIHWKASARQQELMVKNYEATPSTLVHIVMDLEPNTYPRETGALLEDKLLECVLSVLYHALEQEIPAEVLYYDGELQKYQVKEQGHFDSFHQKLVSLPFGQHLPFLEVMKLVDGIYRGESNIVIVTSRLSYDLAEEMNRLIQKGIYTVIIYVSPASIIPVDEEEIRTLREGLRESGVVYLEVSLDDDISKALSC